MNEEDMLEIDKIFESIPDLQRCDDCSEPSADLIVLEDSDESVGYHATLLLCPVCVKRRQS